MTYLFWTHEECSVLRIIQIKEHVFLLYFITPFFLLFWCCTYDSAGVRVMMESFQALIINDEILCSSPFSSPS